MEDKYLELLKETFTDLSKVKIEKVKELVDATTHYFKNLQEKVNSEDPELKKEAEEDALAVKELLEQQMERLVESSGMNKEQLHELMSDPTKISEQEKNLIQEVQDKFQETVTPEKKVKKQNKNHLRILG